MPVSRLRGVDVPWTEQPQDAAEVDWSNPLTRGLVDSFDLSNNPRSLVLGTSVRVAGTRPTTGAPTPSGTSVKTEAGGGVFYFERNDSKYCPAEQSHVALLSVDSISGSGFDGIFGTADIPTFGSLGPYFASTTYVDTGAGVWSPSTMYQDGVGVFILSVSPAGKTAWWKGKKIASSAGGTAPTYTTSRMIFSQGRQVGTTCLVRGSYLWHHLFARGLSDDEARALSANFWQLLRPRTQYIPTAAAGGGVTGPVGLATETDTAIALAPGASVGAVGLALETDTAFARAALQLRAVGLASETDAALALAGRLIRPAGLATETDTALALDPGALPGIVGTASETDTALPLAGRAIRPTGLATEADAALALVARGLAPVGLAVETDTAFALFASGPQPVGLAVEADQALALLPKGEVSGASGASSPTPTPGRRRRLYLGPQEQDEPIEVSAPQQPEPVAVDPPAEPAPEPAAAPAEPQPPRLAAALPTPAPKPPRVAFVEPAALPSARPVLTEAAAAEMLAAVERAQVAAQRRAEQNRAAMAAAELLLM